MPDKYPDERQYPVTVVIATLGGPTLEATLAALNRGTTVPAEILVCIPGNEARRVSGLREANVKVVVTECRGQVAQRAIGFKAASSPIVVQLDDDMLVDAGCLTKLATCLWAHGPKAAVAPALVDLATDYSIYRRPKRNRVLEQLYYWSTNGQEGYQQGTVDKSGSAIGVDPGAENDATYDVEWLPGGCVMHFKENLILENFYPFQGKAYCEDIIHSHHLRSRGVRLVVHSGAICRLEVESSAIFGPREFLREVASDFRARRYFMRLRQRSSVRLYFFYLASCLSYGLKKLNSLRTRAGRQPSA